MQQLSINTKYTDTVLEIRRSLCFIAGVAYILQRDYTISDIVLSGTPSFQALYDNYTIGPKDYKNLLREAKYRKKSGGYWKYDVFIKDPVGELEQFMRSMENQSKKNAAYIQSVKESLGGLGFAVTDTVEHTTRNIGHTVNCDRHTIRAAIPAVTPDYFAEHFESVFLKYREILSMPVVTRMSERLSEGLRQRHANPVKERNIYYQVTPYHIECRGSSLNTCKAKFNDFGMAKLDESDFVTYCAVGIAVLHKVLRMADFRSPESLELTSPIPSWGPNDYVSGFRLSMQYQSGAAEPTYTAW